MKYANIFITDFVDTRVSFDPETQTYIYTRFM
jgi:hypothetical protein